MFYKEVRKGNKTTGRMHRKDEEDDEENKAVRNS